MPFAFHAVPPSGEWVNDPNGLVFLDGRYRLFAQYASDGPEYKSIGWARLSSDDLVHWDWDGAVIPADSTGLAYSGSVTTTDGELIAWLTRHAPPLQRQYRLSSKDAGVHWHQGLIPLGPEGRNMRDPFVFEWRATGERRMLLAEPCDWNDWAIEPASRISVWQDADGGWRRVGTIGPWSPPGVMWEVPVLIDCGASQFLIVSMIDRRNDMATCSVRAWRGRFEGCTFKPDDPGGELLDHGPDFYATCFNTQPGWPDGQRVMVAWASNWGTARATSWPGDVRGGPITLPRVIDFRSGRLCQSPVATACMLARRERWDMGSTLTLDFDGRFKLLISSRGIVTAQRTAPAWSLAPPLELAVSTDLHVFEDCGLLEIFFEAEGRTMTVFIGEGDDL